SINSVLDYVIFEYGDMAVAIPDPMVSIVETDVKISNSIFRKSFFSALALFDSNSEIENSVFEDNEGDALSIYYGKPKIKNCEFKRNQSGISITGETEAEITNNTFSENKEPVLMEINSLMTFSNNILNNNSLNGILISYPDKLKAGTTTLRAFNYPYVLEESLVISDEAVLIIQPRVIIKALGDFPLFKVWGNLIANGTEESPIVFTSLKDDNYGGDTNNDKENSQSVIGDWQDIKILGKANLKNLKLRYSKENPLILEPGSEVILENIFIEPRVLL
ncbi:MAG: right-handed parallel beta-helix repeat-containing protein, partial [Patescibacteria group bacterium]